MLSTLLSPFVSATGYMLSVLGSQRWWHGGSSERLKQAEVEWLRLALASTHTASTHATIFDVPVPDPGHRGEGPAPVVFMHTLQAWVGKPAASFVGVAAPPIVMMPGYGQALGCYVPALNHLSKLVEGGDHDRGERARSGRAAAAAASAAPAPAPGRNIFLVDWLGWGGSSRPKFECRTREEAVVWFVSSLEAWRCRMGIEQFALVGHSMGAMLSAEYALRYPKRVAELVLVSPAGLAARSPAPEVPVKLPSTTPFILRQVLPTIFRFVRWLWKVGVTPHDAIRVLGPLGFWIVRGYNKAMARKRPHQTDEWTTLYTDYQHQVLAGNGSGEYALRFLLNPPAISNGPSLEDLLGGGNLAMPLHILSGDHTDWVRAVNNREAATADSHTGRANDAIGDKYRCIAERMAATTAPPARVTHRALEGGHMIMMDNHFHFAEALADIFFGPITSYQAESTAQRMTPLL